MKRPIRIEGNIAYVPLTKGYEAVIDAADVPLVGDSNWTATVALRPDGSIRSVYAKRSMKIGAQSQTIYLHRAIGGTDDAPEVDHRDGNGLNNRRSNLRPATKGQNMHNSRLRSDSKSRLKGASFHKARGKWQSQIKVNGKNRGLGLFNCPTAAHFAYIKASRALHGEFGRTA